MRGMDPKLVSWNHLGENLGAILAHRAAHRAAPVFLHLVDDHGREAPFTHAALLEGARGTAAALQALGVRPGDRVMLGLPTGLAFLTTFFGVLLAGATVVPFYPPARTRGLDDYQRGLATQIARVAPRLVVTFARARLAIEAAAFQAGAGATVCLAEALEGRQAAFGPVAVAPEATARIQFTSGSTGAPKGVMLTHRAILENLAALGAAVPSRPGEAVVSWLPLYHDMGLIGMLLLPLFLDLQLVLMSPQAFLLDAKRWLWAIHRHRATISTAPTFAYQLVANRLQDSELAGLDLSSWRLAYNGAEPCLPATHQQFSARLAPHGFNPGALRPIYGLAELAVGAAFSPADRPARVDRVAADALEAEGLARPAPAAGPEAAGGREPRAFASVGPALAGYAIRATDPAGRPLPERHVGEIRIAGPSLMQGYLGEPAETARALTDGWLRTGDLGYLADGELYLVGRVKDMILKAGRNYAPHDLELLAGQVAGVRAGCVVAFGVPDAARGTEAVVVLAETREHQARYPELAAAIGRAVASGLGLLPDRVELLPPGHLPKTSSGKLRRAQAMKDWRAGSLAAAQEPGMWALTRSVGQALVHRATQARPSAGPAHA